MPQPFLNPKTPHVVQKLYYLLNFFDNTKLYRLVEKQCTGQFSTPRAGGGASPPPHQIEHRTPTIHKSYNTKTTQTHKSETTLQHLHQTTLQYLR